MQISMHPSRVQAQANDEFNNYYGLLAVGHWTLEHAHSQLTGGNLSLFQIAGLAKAIACFQCSEN